MVLPLHYMVLPLHYMVLPLHYNSSTEELPWLHQCATISLELQQSLFAIRFLANITFLQQNSHQVVKVIQMYTRFLSCNQACRIPVTSMAGPF